MELMHLILTGVFYLAIMVTAFFFISNQVDRKNGAHKSLVAIFVLTCLSVFQDTVYRMQFEGHITLPNGMYLGAIIIGFLLLPAISGVWFLYIVNSVYIKKVPKKYVWLVVWVLNFNTLLTLLSFIPGTDIYFVLKDGGYSRGSFFFVHALIYAFFYLAAIIIPSRYFRTVHMSQRYIYFVIFTLPILGSIGQSLMQYVPFLLLSNVFSFMILAMGIQYVQSNTDYLTGLANRRNLSTYLDRKIANNGNQGFSIIMLDLDNFKKINDTLGHNHGDEALRLIARFLTVSCNTNQFVARYGGDEFVIISNQVDPAAIEKKINFMRDSFKEHVPEKFKEFELGFSAGYMLIDHNAKVTVTELISEIDDRMFKDKRSRNGEIK